MSTNLINFGACLMVTAHKYKQVEGSYNVPLKWSREKSEVKQCDKLAIVSRVSKERASSLESS